MNLIKIFFLSVIVLFIFEGCCSSNYLQECSCELDVDTTEFLIPRLASSTYPLEREDIEEEINKDSVVQWVKDYYQEENIEGSLFWYYWEEIKDKLKDQDRIFYYTIDLTFGGTGGLAIVRNCKIIMDITLYMVQT